MSLVDQETRRQAASDFDHNLVVVAGAGTGKTSLLVERALNALLSRRVELPRLAAITFTRKAAAELGDKLGSQLELIARVASEEPKGTPAARSLAWLTARGLDRAELAARAVELLESLETARLGTVHSFAAELLRAHPLEAGVDPDFEIDEGERFEQLARREWPRFLEQELSGAAARRELWQEVLGSFELEAVEAAAMRIPSFAFMEASVGGGGEELRRRLSQLSARLGAARNQAGERINRNLADAIQAWTQLAEAWIEGGEQALARTLADEELAVWLRKDPAVGAAVKRADPALHERLAADAKRIRSLLQSLASSDERVCQRLIELLRPFGERVRQELLKSGAVDFDGLLVLARRLLRDHRELRRAEAAGIDMLLVDEFQDTDPIQYEVLFYLCEDPQQPPVADAWQTRLLPGRLFIVGDPKQSIYRFRGADISAFERAVEHVCGNGGRLLELRSNFRSSDAIVEPVNKLFEDWIGADPCDPGYAPIHASRTVDPEPPAVELWLNRAPGRAHELRRHEARLIGDWLLAHHGKPGVVGDQPLEWRHVALLFAAMTPAAIYQRELRQRGIPFVVDGGRIFYERSEVMELLSLLTAATEPADQVALVAVARSSLGAVPDRELAEYAAAGGRWCFEEQPSPERHPNLARCFGLVRETASLAASKPAEQVLRWLLEDTALLPLHAAAHEGAQRVANLRKAAARVAERVRRGHLGLREAIAVVAESARAERAEGESPLADETVEAVRLLSIHKAKGLEYPLVIVPDLARQRGGGEWVPLELHCFGGDAIAVSGQQPLPCNTAAIEFDSQERDHRSAELKRLLYVATTRAEQHLILVASVGAKGAAKAPWIEGLRQWQLDLEASPLPERLVSGRVELRVDPEFTLERVAVGPDDTGLLESAELFQQLRQTAASASGPALRTPAGLAEEGLRREQAQVEGSSEQLPRDLARALGACVHRLLEHAELDEPELLWRGAAALARDEAARRGLEELELLRELRGLLRELLDSPLRSWLRALDVVARELPLLYQDAAGVWQGVVDLIYREDGRLVVADYKTEDPGPEPRKAAERHRAQLEVYARGLERALGLGEPPPIEVIFVRGGQRVRLE